jgi:hypothetical protein
MGQLFMTKGTPHFGSFLKLAEALRELEVTIGPRARPAIAAVRDQLTAAAALREQGRLPAAIETIRDAMRRLALLGRELDPAEGMLMKLIADRLSDALQTGDKGAAKASVNFMRQRAGDPKDDPDNDW